MPTIIRSDPKAREKPCLRCGFSLRKVLDAKHCPQCGMSVWLSLNQNDSLDWSKPSWLRRMSIGAGVMALSQVLAYAAYALIMMPVMAMERRYVYAAVVGGAYLILYHLGLLILAAYEGRHPDRLQGYRLAARIVSGILIVAGVIFIAIGVSRLGSGWPVFRYDIDAMRGMPATSPATAPGGQINEDQSPIEDMEMEGAIGGGGMTLLIEAMLIASGLATWALVRKLAQRIPNSTVARICGYLMLVPLLSLFKVLPFFAVFLGYWLHWLMVYVPWIYIPFAAGLLGYMAIAFHKAAGSAEKSWAAETGPIPPVIR